MKYIKSKTPKSKTPGPMLTPYTYQKCLPNFECLSRIQRPRKPPETRFCDLKTSNNAIIVKIDESVLDFDYCTATTGQISLCSGFALHGILGLSLVKISAHCLSTWLEQNKKNKQQEAEVKIEPIYVKPVLNIRTGPYFECSLTLAVIDGPYFRMVLIFGWSLFSVIYGMWGMIKIKYWAMPHALSVLTLLCS